ncbi:DUF6541 family protein [Methanobacterium sp. BAmetb5]|uniref:DUF6541 family protein n=1 Tax=Methanobacterium sp. BAmetb5 TaxID=2025351 RepID=UPI000E85C654|nr:DUF6541 family protein [Methanobacterium sp. BAmetb5]AXV38913.1 MAG: hypothetical protein CIT02_00600 [Methanobacterium sp. BAmetb5]
MNMLKQHFEKIFIIISLTFLFLSIVILLIIPPTAGYEISIYDVYPPFFWFSIIFSIVSAQMSLLFGYLADKNKFGIYSYLLIILNDLVLIFLPIIRGYFLFGTGDVMSHLGFLQVIFNSGFIGSNNMYPLIHVLASSLVILTGLDVKTVINFFPQFSSLFFLLSFYLIARSFYKKDVFYLALIFSPILLFTLTYTTFAPYVMGILLLPFIIFLYFKSQSDKSVVFTILLLISLISIVFLHPLISQIYVLLFIVMTLIYYNQDKLFKKEFKLNLRSGMNLILLISVIFFSWNAYLYLVTKDIKKFYAGLIGEGSGSTLGTYTSTISYAQPNYIDLVNLTFSKYGQYIIMGIIGIFCVICLVKIIRNNKIKENYLFSYILPSMMFILFLLLSVTTFVGTYIFDFARFIPLAFIFAIIFIPVCVNKKLKTIKLEVINGKLSKYGIFKLVSFGLILLLVVYFSTFNLYFSPIVKTSNEQMGKAEFNGMATFFDIRNDNFQILSMGISPYRIYDAIYGKNVKKKMISYEGVTPPDHFGYSENSSFSQVVNQSTYFILSKRGEILYPSLYSEYKDKWRFNPSDFQKLKESDNGVHRIYSNGDLNIFLME